jgi:hypothetical protein
MFYGLIGSELPEHILPSAAGNAAKENAEQETGCGRCFPAASLNCQAGE